jgi:hypothetical protein
MIKIRAQLRTLGINMAIDERRHEQRAHSLGQIA